MAQPGDFAWQVKNSSDIVRVIGEYVRLKKTGGVSYKGLCPFHQEKTPSFSVHGGHQFYHCFGCGASGDVFKFVMEVEKLTFPETLRHLAERAGIPIPRQRGPEADAEARLRTALLDVHEAAASFFQQQLAATEGAATRKYLERRRVSADLIREFRLGYAPVSGNALLRLLERTYSTDVLESSGLILRRDSGGHFDRFRGRLMFPIASESGKVIAFGGRALNDEDQPKYLNSSETPIYRKSRVLFNYHRARDVMRREGRVVLVEGYMDAIGVFSAGVPNVVASCGTSLTLQHVKALAPMVKTVVVNYDPDSAGASAAEKSLSTLLEEGLDARVLSLPGGQDPDEFVRERGAEMYRAELQAAPSFFHFLVERARAKFDLATPGGRTEAGRHLLQYINKLPDAIARAEMAKDLADRLGLDRNVIGRELATAAAERRSLSFGASPKALSSVTAREKELLRIVLEDEEARAGILQAMADNGGWEDWTTAPIFRTFARMEPEFAGGGLAALLDRLEPSQREVVASIANDESLELISVDKALGYVEEFARVRRLRQRREELKKELAAAADALAQAKIAFEIKEIEAELNETHLVPRGPLAGGS